MGALCASLLTAGYLVFRPSGFVVALDAGVETAHEEGVPASLAASSVDREAAVRTRIEPRPSDVVGLPATVGDVEPAPQPTDVRRWIDDLRDDDIRGNAGSAMVGLRRAGAAAVPMLTDALGSIDGQQRHFAALILRDLDAEPVPLLCTVSVEALTREVSRELRATIMVPGATDATRYLARHVAAARPALRFGLGSGDDQQRFLCAFLLACGGESVDTEQVVRELMSHLGDNRIRGDALMATHGLFRLASATGIGLAAWKPYVDEQARSLLDLIELDLRQPPRDRGELAARGRMQRVTGVYFDPALQFDVNRSRVPTW